MSFVRRKKRHSEESDTEGTWAISYGDMITLLLSFFVIFFTTDFDKNKEEDLSRNLILQMEGLFREVKIERATADINHAVSPSLFKESKQVKVEQTKLGKNLLVVFKNASFFDFGEVDLRNNTELYFKDFSKAILPFLGQYKLHIKAFTDKTPVSKRSKRYKDNLELSALRSIAAMRELQKSGIPLKKMVIAGHGIIPATSFKKIGINPKNKKQLDELSRTIMILIERDESKRESS